MVGEVTLSPHADWQEAYVGGTLMNGAVQSSCAPSSGCPSVEWLGRKTTTDGVPVTTAPALTGWWGSLIQEQVDASGLRYLRNRFYDPSTGQFTQADPIGLAGGRNLYAYAGGDPVNFRDPFGLCPVCVGWAVLEIGASAYDSYDLAKTSVDYLRGRASGAELGATAAGAALGVLSLGGGLGKAARFGLSGRASWGDSRTLARHFADHGADFGATNANDYAGMASTFFRDSQRRGIATKIDADGVIRIYDRHSNTFGAFNPDGTTKTFFKPTSSAYWDRQPGRSP